MNQVKTILLVLVFSTQAFAQQNHDGCVDCDQNLSGLPNVSDLEKFQESINPDIEVLANQICANMHLIGDTEARINDKDSVKIYEALEKNIMGYLHIDHNTPNYRSKITDFWNKHKDKMVCTEEMIGFDYPQHILKRVIELGAISSFYFGYLLRDRNTNVNAVEYRDGNPETVIDYIDTILADPQADDLYDTAQVRQLRAFLTTLMNAKTAEELLNTH